jgi:hypothetical protein
MPFVSHQIYLGNNMSVICISSIGKFLLQSANNYEKLIGFHEIFIQQVFNLTVPRERRVKKYEGYTHCRACYR